MVSGYRVRLAVFLSFVAIFSTNALAQSIEVDLAEEAVALERESKALRIELLQREKTVLELYNVIQKEKFLCFYAYNVYNFRNKNRINKKILIILSTFVK